MVKVITSAGHPQSSSCHRSIARYNKEHHSVAIDHLPANGRIPFFALRPNESIATEFQEHEENEEEEETNTTKNSYFDFCRVTRDASRCLGGLVVVRHSDNEN